MKKAPSIEPMALLKNQSEMPRLALISSRKSNSSCMGRRRKLVNNRTCWLRQYLEP